MQPAEAPGLAYPPDTLPEQSMQEVRAPATDAPKRKVLRSSLRHVGATANARIALYEDASGKRYRMVDDPQITADKRYKPGLFAADSYEEFDLVDTLAPGVQMISKAQLDGIFERLGYKREDAGGCKLWTRNIDQAGRYVAVSDQEGATPAPGVAIWLGRYNRDGRSSEYFQEFIEVGGDGKYRLAESQAAVLAETTQLLEALNAHDWRPEALPLCEPECVAPRDHAVPAAA